MKKHIFRHVALLFAAAACLTACKIDDPVAGPIVGGGSKGPETPAGKEYIITADGDFSDWDAVPAAEVVTSTVPDDAFYTTGKKVKVYAGATYINLYVEFKEEADMPVQIMHLYFDTDNDQTTGMGNPAWTNDGTDILFEGYLVDEDTGENIAYDPTLFAWAGEDLSGDWEWEEAVAPGLGICSNSEFVELPNGNKAFEMTILRDAIPGLGKVFRLGVALQYDWNDIAYLPSGSAVNNNGTMEHGAVENLLVGAANTPAPSVPSNAHIDIDGDFADWDALDPLDLFEFVAPDDAASDAAYMMRAAYNADYLYVYLEYDGSEEANIGVLDFYMDSDAAFENGLATTGFGGWLFANDGSDLLFEAAIDSFDPEIFMYTGEPMSGVFDGNWTSLIAPGTGVATGSQAVVLDNGHTAVEFAISRTVPGMGDKCLIGAVFQKADWSATAGMLPVGSAVDGQNVIAEKMLIDFTKRNTVNQPEPPTPPTPTESEIKIDGDLSDWDEVDTYVATLPADAATNYPAAKKLKVATDKNYIYLYVEYDNSYTASTMRLNVFMDTDMAFDGEGNATTGFGGWLFANDGTEIYLCGLMFDGAVATPGWAWADIFMYSGEPVSGVWSWTSLGIQGATADSAATDLGDGVSAIEASIMRAAIPGLGEQVKLGIYLQDNWTECGILPQGPATAEGGFGAAEKLTIALP